MNMLSYIRQAGYSLRGAARALGVAPSTLSAACRGHWPRTGSLREELLNLLARHQVFPAAPQEPSETDNARKSPSAQEKEKDMLIRKQNLTPAAKKAFHLVRAPFDELLNQSEIFMTPDSRYVRECLWHVANHGGMLAVVGESGSGKSTLRKDLHERIRAQGKDTILIYPSVLCSAESERGGCVLRAAHIMEAIISTVAPHTPLPRSPELRARTLQKVLEESHTAGFRHCLIIEEAYTLNKHTLKALKRFYELEDGFTRLLSIILIGQTELADKLGEGATDIREVVQRCEIVQLPPLSDVEGYVRHRVTAAGAAFEDIFTADAMPALEEWLTRNGHNLLYPLAVGNALHKALNLAAETGESRISRDIILALN